MLLLVAFLFASVALAQRVDWFLAYKLSDAEITALTERSCFRGMYGVEQLSLFTCLLDEMNGKVFANLPRDAPLCVVETNTRERALEVVTKANDTEVLFTGDDVLILTSTDLVDYPSTCGSRSDYHGAAMNVIRVSRQPHVPLPEWIPSPRVINPKIVALANRILAADLNATVIKLASYLTRQSQSTQAVQAADEIARNFSNAGAVTSQQAFRTGYCNNVFGSIRGTDAPEQIIMIGGHLDDRSTNVNSVTQTAPGADDNASGVAAVLTILKAIQAAGVTFRKTIRFATWCGEEQGLYGSAFAAQDSRSTGENIQLYVNVDMLGYQPGTSPVLGIVDRAVSAAVAKDMRDVIGEYYPSLTLASATACCSDQQSYNNQGFPAGGLFEQGGGGVTYPQYHTSDDTPNKLNYLQLQAFTRAALVFFATRAEIN